MKKIFAISDIHGCYDEMIALFHKLPLNPQKDTVVFIGDYIDRGLDSKKVVTQLIKWKKKYPHWIFLKGNHEDILENWLNKGQKYQENEQWSCFLNNGGKETLKSYKNKIPQSHVNFLLKETKTMHETKDYVFVHGGLLPNVSLEELKVTMGISKSHYEKLSNAMLWARDDFIDSKYDWGKKIIFGHTPAYPNKGWGKFGQPIIMKNKIGIDGAVCPPGNKNLIALELPIEKFYFQKSFYKLNDVLTKSFLENAKHL